MIFQRKAPLQAVLRATLSALALLVSPAALSIVRAGGEPFVQYVDCDRGNDANNGLTPETAKRTVRAALHSVPDGGARTLLVSGNCTETRSSTGTLSNAVKSHKCAVSLRDDVATFKLRFQRPPDFYTVDDLGIQALSFQYFVEAGAPPSGIADFYAAAAGEADASTKTVLRGDEIHVDDEIRVHAIEPFYPGSWGPILDTVPYLLEDSMMTFEVPLASLKDDGDGRFFYFLEWYEYGSWGGVTLAGLCRPPGHRPTRGKR